MVAKDLAMKKLVSPCGERRCCGKGCTGWSVAMTRCCQSRPPNGGLLTDAVINDSYRRAPPRRFRGPLSTGKRLTKFSVAYGSLQISFACHPSRGRKGKRRKTRFPLRGSAAVAAKGCTGWSVAMTLCCHPDRQTAACLPMQSLTILTTVHPRAAAAVISTSRRRKRNFNVSPRG